MNVRSFARALAALSLVTACQADPLEGYDVPVVDTADGSDFSLCAVPCRAGEVCRAFRCVPLGDAAVDARADVVDASLAPDGPAVACCPIDRFTTCGCVRVGGARVAGRECRQVCGEGYPEFWLMRTDFSGCPVWLSSGIACRDGGLDAGAPTDAAPDDVADAPLDGALEASTVTDLGIMQ